MTRDTTETPGPRLPWAGKVVRTEDIEAQLSFFWRMSADNVRTSQNINVRTSVLNLVICVPDVESAKQASTTMRNLSSTHVARVILLILDNTAEAASTVTTWVTLRSFPVISDTMRHSFEQITLFVSGSAIRAASNIIQPLLKPHLPVYIWWLGDPPSDSVLFQDLTQISNRIIVDSSSFFTPEHSIRTLYSLLNSSPNSALSDLNWGRITSWRELIAQFFDVMEYKPYLNGVNSIEIEHAVMPFAHQTQTEQGDVSPNPSCALLLASWLKTRLGWKLSSDPKHAQYNQDTGNYEWQMPRPTGSLATRTTGPLSLKASKLSNAAYGELVIRPRVQSDMRPGSICMFRMVSTMDNKSATFMINRDNDPEHVLTSVELAQGTRPRRTVNLTATHDVSELLHDELEITVRDHLYEETLQEAAALLE